MTDLWTAVKDLPIAIESSSFEALLPSGPSDEELVAWLCVHCPAFNQIRLNCAYYRDRRASVDYESRSPVARFAP